MDFNNPPELQFKIQGINGLTWKRHYTKNSQCEFKFPNIIPSAINHDFSVAVCGLTNNKSWYNILEGVKIRLFDTENQIYWTELGEVTLVPGLYRTPFEFSQMFNKVMDDFAKEKGLQRCPQTLAKFENDKWTCALWPARYSTFVPDGPFGRERVKDFNICGDLPLIVIRILGLDEKYQHKENQGHDLLIESALTCNMTPINRMIQLHSNIKVGSLIDFDIMTGDISSIPESMMEWSQMVTSKSLGDDLCFWFTDSRGQAVKTDECISFDLQFKKTIKEELNKENKSQHVSKSSEKLASA